MKCEIVIPIIAELSVLNLIFFEKISKKNSTEKQVTTNIQ